MRELIVIKPDAVKRGLIGRILSRFEDRGIAIKGLKMINVSREDAEKLYKVHKEKPFYNDLINYITSSKVVACVLEADDNNNKGNNSINKSNNSINVINIVRKMIGATNPSEAEPGTIRGDFGLEVSKNIIHASDSEESANREIQIFFKDDEII